MVQDGKYVRSYRSSKIRAACDFLRTETARLAFSCNTLALDRRKLWRTLKARPLFGAQANHVVYGGKKVMNTSGGGGDIHKFHHRSFSRPSSREQSLTFGHQVGPLQLFQFSSLPSSRRVGGSTGSGPPSFRRTLSYLKSVELVKDEENPSFGFNIKGGSDFGYPVHIWRVEENSLADREGLKRGQQIFQANDVDFTNITHANALKVLKGRNYLKLLIDTRMNGSSSNVNKSASIDGYSSYRPSSQPSSTLSASSSYTWLDGRGNTVPPPTPTQPLGSKRVINIDINPGQNLGLMIRGGFEYGLGIYVTGVDPGSLAHRAGLQRGDEILEVNGRNFSTISHDKAVQILKSSRTMSIVASYVGKIPSDPPSSVPILDSENTELIDLTSTDRTKLLTTSMADTLPTLHHNILMDSTNVNVSLFDDEYQDLIAEEEKLNDQNLELDYVNSEPSSRLLGQDLEKATSIMGMIEEKARTVLTKSEHSRFTFYRLEYQQGFLPIQTFVRILLELLNTVEKYTLLTEVREIIRPCDMSSFDELIYNKDGSLMGGKKLHRDFVGNTISIPPQDPMLLPLVPVNTPNSQNVNLNGVRRMSPNNPQLAYNETTFTTTTPEGGRQLLITHGDTQNALTKLQQHKLQQGFVNIPSSTGATPINPNACVRYKIRVQKTKPILGIAIEGGINTPHRLPRVIDVNTEGSAYGSQLKPGQVLLMVNGKKLDGMTHEEIARSILDSYVDMSKPQIEFVVVEAKASFVQTQQQLLNVIPPPPGSVRPPIATLGIVPQSSTGG